jgi:hypothetical protein
MWCGKITTSLRCVAAVVNITLHTCTPAQAIDLEAHRAGMTTHRCDASIEHTPVPIATPRFYVASGATHLLTVVPGLTNTRQARNKPRHGPILFEVVHQKPFRNNPHDRIPTR